MPQTPDHHRVRLKRDNPTARPGSKAKWHGERPTIGPDVQNQGIAPLNQLRQRHQRLHLGRLPIKPHAAVRIIIARIDIHADARKFDFGWRQDRHQLLPRGFVRVPKDSPEGCHLIRRINDIQRGMRHHIHPLQYAIAQRGAL